MAKCKTVDREFMDSVCDLFNLEKERAYKSISIDIKYDNCIEISTEEFMLDKES
jgi:hypothetical protein